MIKKVDDTTDLYAQKEWAWLVVGFGLIVNVEAYRHVKDLFEYGSRVYGFGDKAEDWRVVIDPVTEFPGEFPGEQEEDF